MSPGRLLSFIKKLSFIYFQRCCVFAVGCGLSLVAVSGGYSLGAVHRFLLVVSSPVAECGL